MTSIKSLHEKMEADQIRAREEQVRCSIQHFNTVSFRRKEFFVALADDLLAPLHRAESRSL